MYVVIFAFYNLILFLNENFYRSDQSNRHGKKSGFVDSGFVKTCDEFVIGWVFHSASAPEECQHPLRRRIFNLLWLWWRLSGKI